MHPKVERLSVWQGQKAKVFLASLVEVFQRKRMKQVVEYRGGAAPFTETCLLFIAITKAQPATTPVGSALVQCTEDPQKRIRHSKPFENQPSAIPLYPSICFGDVNENKDKELRQVTVLRANFSGKFTKDPSTT